MLINRILSQVLHNTKRIDLIGRIILAILTLSVILLNSCQKEPDLRIGFNSPFQPGSDGSVILYVSGSDLSVELKGSINLNEGSVCLELVNPSGIPEYSDSIYTKNVHPVALSFNAKKGFWKLKYRSNQGIGHIDLHLVKWPDKPNFF